MNHAKHPQAADTEPVWDAVETKGRCSYCDQRCNADATYHSYCRDEFEHESRMLARKPARGLRTGSEEQR